MRYRIARDRHNFRKVGASAPLGGHNFPEVVPATPAERARTVDPNASKRAYSSTRETTLSGKLTEGDSAMPAPPAPRIALLFTTVLASAVLLPAQAVFAAPIRPDAH